MTKLFLIAGMGADTRLYNKIDIPATYDVIPVDWIEFDTNDTLTIYAQKLVNHYHITPNSIVVGNSLGGMLAIEIAKTVKLKKTIIMSTIKTIDEAPGYFGVFRTLPVYKLLNNKLFNMAKLMFRFFFGKTHKDDLWLFNDMYDKTSRPFLKWASGAALKWDNKVIPANVHHIHGDKDMIFPVKRIKNATIVKGGTHLMVFDKAKQINKWLKPLLKK